MNAGGLISLFPSERLLKAKRAFTTRRVPESDMHTLISGTVRPVSGNLVLASVQELGKHKRIELISGRRAIMMPGDEIVVCYGNRYAPDQFEALVSEDLGLCDLVAGGGIASREINRHQNMLPPTKIMPIGLIGDANGNPLNVADYRIAFDAAEKPLNIILVVGTAMNAGKTFTAASIVHGMKMYGYSVAAIKATGTGSGNDLWKMKDMGADIILDFTDAGFASTYKADDAAIEEGVLGLVNHAFNSGCEYVVVEVADGLQHQETATLLRSSTLRKITSGVVFAAYDSLGAKAGYEELIELGYNILAISGQIARSPLAMREASVSTHCPIYTPFQLQAGALVPAITQDTSFVIHKLDAIAHQYAQSLSAPPNDVDDDNDDGFDMLQLRNDLDLHDFDYPEDVASNA